MKLAATWVVVLFLLFFVSTRPSEAGDGVHVLAEMLMSVADGLADFAAGLVR